MKPYAFKLKPYISEIIWGGTRLIEDYGMQTKKKNAAEAWVLSAHRSGESTVIGGEMDGLPLSEAVRKHPEICGKNAGGFADFPILIKFIDARDNLSVQVHPTAEYCAETGRGESKTECWYILDCEDDACLILGFKEKITREQFKNAVESGTLTDYIARVPVKKGDFFFIESGTLHAICKGILLAEVQQSSNTTYRVFDYNRLGFDGKPRELHVEDAVAVTKCEPFSKNDCCKVNKLYIGTKRKLADCKLFKVLETNVNGEITDSADENSFVSLLVLDGEGTFEGGESMRIKKGESIFVPASFGEYTLRGEMKILETRV